MDVFNNVIYFYCPMQDVGKEIKLEEYLYETAAEGTLFMPNLTRSNVWRKCKAAVKNDECTLLQKV